jgi:hypothetical protein
MKQCKVLKFIYVFPTLKIFINHLVSLQKPLFLTFYKDVDVSTFERVRNPSVANNISGLTTCELEKLVDTSCDSSLRDMFDVDKLSQF